MMVRDTHKKAHSQHKLAEHISQYVLYGLVGYAAIQFVAFFLLGYNTPYWKNESLNAPLLTDALLGLIYAMVAAAVVLAIASGLHSYKTHQSTAAVINNIPARKISIAVTILTICTLAGGFFLSSTEPMTVNGETYNSWWGLKITGTLVIAIYVLLLTAIGAALFGATRYYRKRK